VWGRYNRQLVAGAMDAWGLDKADLHSGIFDEIRNVVEMVRHEAGKRDPTDPSYGVLSAHHGLTRRSPSANRSGQEPGAGSQVLRGASSASSAETSQRPSPPLILNTVVDLRVADR